MISGAFTALITPFDEDGKIDFLGIAKLLAWHESQGMTGVVMAGTNGEGPSLSSKEKFELIGFTTQNAGRLHVIAGLGTCSISEAIWLTKRAKEAGAIASLALSPFYFRNASENGVYQWFKTLLDSSDLPCIFYNFPKMTGFTLSPNLMEKLLEHRHSAGIKDSSGDQDIFDQYLKISKEMKKSFFVGDERLLLKNLTSGGSGTISGLANSFPNLIARQINERSEVLQMAIDQASENIKCHPQPAVHKYILNQRKLPGGNLRPPLEPLNHQQTQQVDRFLENFIF